MPEPTTSPQRTRTIVAMKVALPRDSQSPPPSSERGNRELRIEAAICFCTGIENVRGSKCSAQHQRAAFKSAGERGEIYRRLGRLIQFVKRVAHHADDPISSVVQRGTSMCRPSGSSPGKYCRASWRLMITLSAQPVHRASEKASTH